MSAFDEEPRHFLEWLQRSTTLWQPHAGWAADDYVSRRIYRDYLQSLLAPYQGDVRFGMISQDIVSLEGNADFVSALTRDGRRFAADAAILATGNEPPFLEDEPWRHVGWSNRPLPEIDRDAPVAIIGTGLSMIDAVISLLDRGHEGEITAISRRGLMPRAHGATEAIKFNKSALPMSWSLSATLRWLRGEIRKAAEHERDWRSVIDALRPHTQDIWQALPLGDKARFLRHLRPWWDVHRHRMAPQIAARINKARADGQLQVLSARINRIDGNDEGARVWWMPRGSAKAQYLDVRLVIECRGASGDLDKTHNPLLASMRDAGVIRSDPVHLGIDVSADCEVIDSQGQRSRRLFALGPITAGRFWEIVAIPDIRVQAGQLANRLAESA